MIHHNQKKFPKDFFQRKNSLDLKRSTKIVHVKTHFHSMTKNPFKVAPPQISNLSNNTSNTSIRLAKKPVKVHTKKKKLNFFCDLQS